MVVDDRRYRPALVEGEVAMIDDQKQAVAIRRARIEIGTIGASMVKVAKNGDAVAVGGDWATWFSTVGAAVKSTPPATPIGTVTATAKAVIE
jgi:hypothetical protein